MGTKERVAMMAPLLVLVGCQPPHRLAPAPEPPLAEPVVEALSVEVPAVEPSPPSEGPPRPAELAEVRAALEVVHADDGSDPSSAVLAAVPLLCHDGTGWIADREACVALLRAAPSFAGQGGEWRSTGEVITVYDRDYRGIVLEEGARSGLAFFGVGGVPQGRCRRTETAVPAFGDFAAQLSPALPKASTFAAAEARSTAFLGDFDGDGAEDQLLSVTLEAEGRLDLVLLKRQGDVRILGQEWSLGGAFGGEPEHRLIDLRGLSCFELDGRPGLELVASLRGETEREHLAASFAGADLLPVGHGVFFGD